MQRDLVKVFGPDRSRVVYRFADGWTVRRLSRLADQRREGYLCAHCLRGVVEPDPNCYSLRDTDGLPRVSFSGWARAGHATERQLIHQRGADGDLLVAPHAIFKGAGRASSPLKEEYVARLLEFGASSATEDLVALEDDRLLADIALLLAHTPGLPLTHAEEVEYEAWIGLYGINYLELAREAWGDDASAAGDWTRSSLAAGGV